MNRILFLVVAVVLQIFLALNARAASCTLTQVLNAGTSNAECEKLEKQLAAFRTRAMEKAHAIGTFFRRIEPHQVKRDFKDNNMKLVGFAGRSADFKDTPEDLKEIIATRSAINGILDGLDPSKHIIVHGGTASGFGDLLAKRAMERGFLVMGLTAAAAAKYEPAYMNFLLSTMDPKFGGESSVLVALADSLFVIGSGDQGAREAVAFSYKDKNQLFLVADSRIGGSSYKMAEPVPNLQYFESGTAAVRAFTNLKNIPLEALPDHFERYTDVSSVRDIFGSQRKIIGVSSFVEGKFDRDDILEIADEILRNMSPRDVVIAVSGTVGIPEMIFAQVALHRGFNVIAITSEEAKAKDFMLNLKIAVAVSPTWTNYTRNYVNSLDGLISLNGRETLYEQLILAKGRIPFMHFENPRFAELDYLVNTQFVRDSKGTGFSINPKNSRRSEQIAAAVKEMLGIPRCVLTFGKHTL